MRGKREREGRAGKRAGREKKKLEVLRRGASDG